MCLKIRVPYDSFSRLWYNLKKKINIYKSYLHTQNENTVHVLQLLNKKENVANIKILAIVITCIKPQMIILHEINQA